MLAAAIFLVIALSPGCTAAPGGEIDDRSEGRAGPPVVRVGEWNMQDKVERTDAEWKALLSPEQYRVLRGHSTECAFTGAHYHRNEPGTYRCAGCGLELFRSQAKYDSGTGWPSYFEPIARGHIGMREDNRMFMRRIEVHCARCGGHLGHVFNDGPPPTGLRYCINSVALAFEPASARPAAGETEE